MVLALKAFVWAAAFLLTLSTLTAFAGPIEDRINELNTSELDRVLRESDNPSVSGISTRDLLESVLNGQLDLSPQTVINIATDAIFGELRTLMPLLRDILIICLLGAIIYSLSNAFGEGGASEAGFFVCYLCVAILGLRSFITAAAIMNDMLDVASGLAQAALPIIMSVMAFSGAVASAYMLSPFLTAAISALAYLVRAIVTPALLLGIVLTLVNYMSEKPLLSKMADLIKKGSSLVLKFAAGAFIVIAGVQGVAVPTLNTAAAKSAKAFLNMVPVVGSGLTGAVDIVGYWGSALKSGFMVALIIIVIAVCALPILKLAAMCLMFRLAAALIEPVADARAVKAIDAIGAFIGVMVGACVAAMVMLTFIIVILLYV